MKSKCIKKSNSTKTIIIFIVVLVLLIIIFGLIYKKNFIINKNKETIILKNKENELELKKIQEKIKEDLLKKQNFISANIPIFIYHDIITDLEINSDDKYVLHIDKLDEQLKYIKENGYQTIFCNKLDKAYRYKKPIALTFDDGKISFYNLVFPLLKKYNVKATLFVITGRIGMQGYCTEEQLKEMSNSNIVDVESHTATHLKLTSLTEEEIKFEINESKEALSKLLNKDITVICYPFGRYNDIVLNEVQKTYKFGLTTSRDVYNTKNHELNVIPRIESRKDITLEEYIIELKKSQVFIKTENMQE